MEYGRTVLFVPGDQPHRIRRALDSGSDSVVLDLEDAVADAAKHVARRHVVEALQEMGHPRVLVRVNAPDTAEHQLDFEALTPALGKLGGLVVPKAQCAEQLARVGELVDFGESAAGLARGRTRIVAALEDARGVLAAQEIAATARVATLMFGTLDLSANLGVTPTVAGTEFLHARSHVVLACRAAALRGPLDGPHSNLHDDAGLKASSEAARALGFTGRVVIHPRQIDVVRNAFSPTAAELEHACAVLAAHHLAQTEGLGAARLPDGTFIDRPVVARASALIELNSTDGIRHDAPPA